MENTEDNFETVQTGAGLIEIGFENKDELRLGRTNPGDFVVTIGIPKVGDEVIAAEA